jgi:hypothetical protein
MSGRRPVEDARGNAEALLHMSRVLALKIDLRYRARSIRAPPACAIPCMIVARGSDRALPSRRQHPGGIELSQLAGRQ